MDYAAVAICGFAGGAIGGILGVGGGIVFVPALVIFLDEPQLRAEATSLLAIVPVGLVGALNQNRFGNVRVRDGLIVGVLSPLGVGAGVVLANTVSGRVLEVSFAALALVIALQLLRRAARAPARP
jgi:uncharacterized membrane protein YfcA